jgi:putative hydrolase of the HAD superfamily
MQEVLAELKSKGYKLYLLSNAAKRQHAYWPRVPGNEFFEGTVISADWRLVKPQPEIYHALLSRFGLQPQECLFVDDSAQNVEGANFVGMDGIVFHGDAEEFRTELKAHHIL